MFGSSTFGNSAFGELPQLLGGAVLSQQSNTPSITATVGSSSAINADMAVLQPGNTVTGYSVCIINGQCNLSQSFGTVLADGTSVILGSGTSLQASHGLSSNSFSYIYSSVIANQDNHAVSSLSEIGILSNSVQQQQNNLLISGAVVPISATLAGQQYDTLVSSSTSTGVISGSINSTQQNNLLISGGKLVISATGSSVQNDNNIVISAANIVTSNIILISNDNLLLSSSTLPIIATIASTSNGNILSSNGQLNFNEIICIANLLQDENTIQSSSGSLSQLIATSILLQQSNSANSTGILHTYANISTAQPPQTTQSGSSIIIIGDALLIQSADYAVGGLSGLSNSSQSDNIATIYAKILPTYIVPSPIESDQYLNFLSPTGFKLEIDKIPGVTFFTQECSIPVVEMYFAEIQTPMLDYSVPGNKLKYDSFTISFMIDEQMRNYSELITWLYGINNPESLDNNRQYSFAEQYRMMYHGNSLYSALFSDAYLHILTNNNKENICMHFVDMFPIALSNIKFSTSVDDVRYLTCDATFKFSYFKKLINNQ